MGVYERDGKVVRIEISSAKDETKIDRWERYEPKGDSPGRLGLYSLPTKTPITTARRDKWETYEGEAQRRRPSTRTTTAGPIG